MNADAAIMQVDVAGLFVCGASCGLKSRGRWLAKVWLNLAATDFALAVALVFGGWRRAPLAELDWFAGHCICGARSTLVYAHDTVGVHVALYFMTKTSFSMLIARLPKCRKLTTSFNQTLSHNINVPKFLMFCARHVHCWCVFVGK
jgi:hypothetical protein